MINEETRAKIRRLYYADHYPIHAISRSLGVHHDCVKDAINFRPVLRARVGESMLDPYRELINQHLEQYPSIRATRLVQILKDRGYAGSVSRLRQYLQPLRAQIKKPYMRMTVHAGEQAQVDWAHCGEIKIGRGKRKLYLFVMVLSYSRAVFARFCVNLNTATFLQCHELGFEYFGGVPRVILYDNLKSVVLARRGEQIRFNDDLLELSGFYGFEPRPCSPYRGNEKGRVERTIRYLRENYLSARPVSDLKTMNESLLVWCNRVANHRPWPDDRSLRVDQKWRDEKSKLIVLTERRRRPKEQLVCRSGKTPWIIYDLNFYSIPPDYVGKAGLLVSDFERVEIFYENLLVTAHKRNYGRGERIEQAEHKKLLIHHKKFGRQNIIREKIVKDFPSVDGFLAKMFERGHDINSLVRKLERLVSEFGAKIFEQAMSTVTKNEHVSIEALRICMQGLWRKTKVPASVPITLPDNPKIKELQVSAHPLSNYDQI